MKWVTRKNAKGCSFESIVRKYGLTDPALQLLARTQFPLYDALYAWCAARAQGQV